MATAPQELAEQHYDAPVALFEAFLDRETMSYTMAYYGRSPEEVSVSTRSLGEAQLAKFRLIADRMGLGGDENLINLGCGFGYFESYLLHRFPHLRVTSTTHSRVQEKFLRDRMKDCDDILSSPRFRLFFGEINDRSAQAWGEGEYDVVCSVGVLEQIKNVEAFFHLVAELLKPEGVTFHHLIVSRDLIRRLQEPQQTLIGHYFPGGRVRPFYALQNAFGPFRLEDSWFINGMNYWRTLDAWHAGFWRNLGAVYPAFIDQDGVKYWNDFFVLCKAMFRPESGAAYGNGQYRFVKA
ncbi:MAG: class I SAM-dependent methyltransferase [Pseudomonadota bacterium]|nr:class I SAM-dependent methyltransferase [Pseudomonadota bacterium]